MVRPFPGLIIPMQKLHFLPPVSVNFLIVLTAVFSVFTVVTFLCGSHGGEEKTTERSFRGKNCEAVVKKVERNLSGTNKAVLLAKMISFRKVHEDCCGGGVEQFDEDGGAIWKKTIIKGEKCRPLSMSGRISYDSDGNLLPE